MMMTQEEAIFKAQAQVDELIDFVRQASAGGRTIDQVERNLWERLLAVGRAMLEGYVSVFGELVIRRAVYGTRETQKHEIVPLDAMLNLPEGDSSYLLQEWDQAFCVQNSYARSRETVERILGIGQSVRTLEQMNGSMTPPTMLGNLLVGAGDGWGRAHSVHDSRSLLVDLHPLDQCPDDLALCRPVGFLHALLCAASPGIGETGRLSYTYWPAKRRCSECGNSVGISAARKRWPSFGST